jgi:hypothetical protein
MSINFNTPFQRYKNFDAGSKAIIKRATSLDDVQFSLHLYQLGLPVAEYWQRTSIARFAFMLPFLNPATDGGCSLGKAIALLDDGDTGAKNDKYTSFGKRLMRIVRLDDEMDIYEFRRLIRYVASKTSDKSLAINPENVGKSLYYWGDKNKKRIFEDYLLTKYSEKVGKEN